MCTIHVDVASKYNCDKWFICFARYTRSQLLLSFKSWYGTSHATSNTAGSISSIWLLVVLNKYVLALISFRNVMITGRVELERRHQRSIDHSQPHRQIVDHRCHRLVIVSVFIIILRCFLFIPNRRLPNQRDFNRLDRKLGFSNISDRDYQAPTLRQLISSPEPF